MTDELRGAVVGAVVAELVSAILKAKAVSVSGFGVHLDKLKCTLESLFPRVWEVQQLDEELTDNSQNGMLTSSRRKDVHELLQQLNNGKELIDECSKLPYWSFWKRHTCCKRLKELDKQLLRFVQMNIHADIWVDTKKLLQNTKELHKKLDDQHGGLIGGSNINTNDFSCIDADLPSVCFDPGLTSEELSRHEVLLNCMTEAHDLEGISFKRSGIEEAEESISKRAKLAGDLTTTITIRKDLESELEMHLKQKDDTITLLTIENSQLLNFIANSHSKTQKHLTCSHENTSTSRTRQESHFSSAECKEKRIVIQDLIEFPMKELVVATNGFNGRQLLGKGGFGEVYKGKLRFTDVAIKRLVFGSTQGMPEFQKEVYILSRMRHPHIVTLLGACFKPVCLVYEFLSNGSLENRLSASIGRAHLSWKIRIRITAQLCSALGFLHSGSVVHGDLKPANILLDNNFWAKISDFGMSHFFTCKLERASSIRRGTMGYMDPEYVKTGMLTFKSDVYAYGIIILRLLTGKGSLGITEEVRRALSAGSLDQILDREAGDWPLHEAIGLAELGLRCCDFNRNRRPSMGEVWTKVQSYL